MIAVQMPGSEIVISIVDYAVGLILRVSVMIGRNYRWV